MGKQIRIRDEMRIVEEETLALDAELAAFEEELRDDDNEVALETYREAVRSTRPWWDDCDGWDGAERW